MKNLKYAIGKVLLFIPWHLVLKWKIKENLRFRAVSAICRDKNIPPCTPDGKDYKDEWYWLDRLCVNYGYFTEINIGTDRWIARQLNRID